jgi:hypothetical protein
MLDSALELVSHETKIRVTTTIAWPFSLLSYVTQGAHWGCHASVHSWRVSLTMLHTQRPTHERLKKINMFLTYKQMSSIYFLRITRYNAKPCPYDHLRRLDDKFSRLMKSPQGPLCRRERRLPLKAQCHWILNYSLLRGTELRTWSD